MAISRNKCYFRRSRNQSQADKLVLGGFLCEFSSFLKHCKYFKISDLTKSKYFAKLIFNILIFTECLLREIMIISNIYFVKKCFFMNSLLLSVCFAK